jgi:rare lipoprotein A
MFCCHVITEPEKKGKYMFKFNKVVMAAVFAGSMITANAAFAADPITNFLDGIFHQNSQSHNQPVSHEARRHGRHAVAPRYEAEADEHHGGAHMVASFYGHGERLASHTASGARFNPHAMAAAHKTLPFGTHLRVCYHGCTTVVVNDRGPFVRGRSLDLTYGAARSIGMLSTASISVERLN